MRFLIRSQIKSKSSITCMGFFLTRIRFFQQKPRSKKTYSTLLKSVCKFRGNVIGIFLFFEFDRTAKEESPIKRIVTSA